MRIRPRAGTPISSAVVRLSIASLDERRRAEDRRVDLDARQPGPQLLEGLLDPAGHLERVGPAELLDDEQQPRAVVDDGVADQRLGVHDAPAHVAEAQRLAVRARRRATSASSSGSTIGRTCRMLQPLVGGLDEPAGADDRAVGVPQQPASSASAVMSITCSSETPSRASLRRVDLHVPLRQPLAPDRDLGDAGHAQQPCPDLPVGDRRHVDQVDLVGGQADLHDPAGRRQRRAS